MIRRTARGSLVCFLFGFIAVGLNGIATGQDKVGHIRPLPPVVEDGQKTNSDRTWKHPDVRRSVDTPSSKQHPVRLVQYQDEIPVTECDLCHGQDSIDCLRCNPSIANRLGSRLHQHHRQHGEISSYPVAEESLVLDGDPDSDRSIELDGITLDRAMAILMSNWSGHRFQIVGKEAITISDVFINNPFSLDNAVQQFEDQTGLIIVRFGNLFVVYSDDAEQELNGRPIKYIYKCRQAKAWDLIAVVEKDVTDEDDKIIQRLPEGFPESDDPKLSYDQANGQTTNSGYTIPNQKVHVRENSKLRKAGNGLSSPLGATEHQIVHHFNGILLRGQYAEVRKAVNFLRTIDRRVPIVFVELLIVQYVHEDGYSWGYDLFSGQIAKGDPFTSNNSGPGFTKPVNGPDFYGPRESGFNIQDLAVDAATGNLPGAISSVGTLTMNFRQNLNHLISENQARIVTNPHIAVINGHKGTVLQNEKFNFLTSNITAGVAQLQSQQVQSLNAVTLLTVTPTVIGSDQIHLAVNATLSRFEANIADGNLQAELLPDQRANDLATSVVLGDHKTLVMGGLVREEMAEDRSKYPVLSKTPLIGRLFRAKNDSKRFIETVIYITPHLDDAEGYEDEYVKQVFEQTEMLQQRGEYIRSENRVDKYLFENRYRQKETLDDQQHRPLKR